MEKIFYVYILASKRKGTLYIGVTSNIVQRIYQHKQGLVKGFTDKYKVHHLVYYEVHPEAEGAFAKEKQLKNWKRAWKIRLIEESNPQWRDLYDEIKGSV